MGFDMDQVARARGAEAVVARGSARRELAAAGQSTSRPVYRYSIRGGAGPDRRFAGAAGGQGGQGIATSHEIV